MNDFDQLRRLLTARHPAIVLPTVEEDHALKLLAELAIDMPRHMWLWSVTRGLRDGIVADSLSVANTEHPAGALVYVAANVQPGAMYVFCDLAGHLKDERTLRALRDAIDAAAAAGATLILLDPRDDMPPVVSALATTGEISLPDEKELEDIIRQTVRACGEGSRITVNLSRQGLSTILRNLQGLSRRQARQILMDVMVDDRRLDDSDVNAILSAKRRALGSGGLLEYVEAPTDISEIGGMTYLKAWLNRRQEAMSAEAVTFGISPPRGVLMLGVQGAGKSLSAKAVATAWGRPLLRLDSGSLYDKWVGESDRKLREALQQAERMAPIILWIDEIEKAFASAASQSSDGGLSKRMFGHLLTWMQEHRAPVFLIATANDIEALPSELLRKGRFDEIFFVDLPNLEARTQIFSIHLRKRQRKPADFDLAALAERSDGFSGAEIEQAVVSALHDAFAARKDLATKHILSAMESSPPLSVTMAEKVEALREWAKGRCVPAD